MSGTNANENQTQGICPGICMRSCLCCLVTTILVLGGIVYLQVYILLAFGKHQENTYINSNTLITNNTLVYNATIIVNMGSYAYLSDSQKLKDISNQVWDPKRANDMCADFCKIKLTCPDVAKTFSDANTYAIRKTPMVIFDTLLDAEVSSLTITALIALFGWLTTAYCFATVCRGPAIHLLNKLASESVTVKTGKGTTETHSFISYMSIIKCAVVMFAVIPLLITYLVSSIKPKTEVLAETLIATQSSSYSYTTIAAMQVGFLCIVYFVIASFFDLTIKQKPVRKQLPSSVSDAGSYAPKDTQKTSAFFKAGDMVNINTRSRSSSPAKPYY